MISTYDELKSAVSRFANRKDANFLATIPDFIALAEAEMRREINARGEVKTISLDLEDDYWPLPCGFDGVVSINGTGDYRKINYVSSDVLDQQGWSNYANGYTISGNSMYFGRAPGAVKLRYRTLFEPLSDRNRCNWLLQKHPDVYLYGALKQTAMYLEDDPRLGSWASLYGNAVAAVNQQAIEQSFSGPLKMMASVNPRLLGGGSNVGYVPTAWGEETGAGSVPVDFLNIYEQALND